MAKSKSDWLTTRVKTKDLAGDFADNTTLHGPNRISGAKNVYERSLWTILFSALLGYTIYGVIVQILAYYGWPVTTSIEIVKEPKQIFPAVTVCNQNRIKSSLLKDSPKYSDLPDIDKTMCACKFVVNTNLTDFTSFRKRKKRSVNLNTDSELLHDIHACSHKSANFERVSKNFREDYKNRFIREYNQILENIHEDERYGQGELRKKFKDDVAILNEVHRRNTKAGREMSKRFEMPSSRDRTIRNVPEPSPEPFLVNHDHVPRVDYSAVVQDSNDWWGFLNATSAKDYVDLANWASVTAHDTKKYGHSGEEFIVGCKFDQIEKCTFEDFKQFQHKRYGNCYTFNNGGEDDKTPARVTSRTGTEYGLELVLFINQAEYVGMFTQEAGVRVSIHNIDTTPFPEDRGFNAAPGTATTFNIRYNKYLRTKLPYGGEDCTEREIIKDNVYNGRYSFLACEKACEQSALRERCQCVSDINTLFTDVPICDLLNPIHTSCRQETSDMIFNGQIACNCVQRCEEMYYSVRYSTTTWPSEKYEGYLFSALSHVPVIADTLKDGIDATLKNVVKLHFTLEELNMQTIKEEPEVTGVMLLSSLGGNCGLFIGLSFLTAFEIGIFMLDLILHGCLWSSLSRNKVQGEGFM